MRGARYDLRGRGGWRRECVLGDAERGVAAVGDRGRHGNSVVDAVAVVRADGGTSERAGAGQAAAGYAEPDDGDEGRQARSWSCRRRAATIRTRRCCRCC